MVKVFRTMSYSPKEKKSFILDEMMPLTRGCYNGMIVRSRAKPRPAQGCLSKMMLRSEEKPPLAQGCYSVMIPLAQGCL